MARTPEVDGNSRGVDSSYGNSDFVEMDPSGRYGRYDEVLGKGAYKTVYKAFDDVDGIEVAWNQVKIEDMLQRAGDIERLYSELHLLRTLKHRNIIKFYHSWIDMQWKNVNFVTEIFTSGSLRQYRKRHRRVQLQAIKHWMRQILQGLVYLHSRDPPIIHRDLKCDNIFINGNSGEVKIGDLGLAAILCQAPVAQSVIGTPEFMAPELYEEHYNELVDIYSFGMCLLEMVTLEYPYSECENAAQIYKKVTMGKKPDALNRVQDADIRHFIEKCLASAHQRPSARNLLLDPFLQSKENSETISTMKRCQEELKVPGETQLDNSFAMEDRAQGHSNVRRFSTPNSTSFEKLQMVDTVDSKECAGKDLDIRIKGRKEGDESILLVIRITNSRGGVRYIQFPFDIEADTAISVASEMVAELELSDQDVTTIAAFIDEEIMNLVPGWRPGLSVEEAGDDKFNRDSLGYSDADDLVENPRRAFHFAVELDETTASKPNACIYVSFEEVGSKFLVSEYPETGSGISRISRYLSSENSQNTESIIESNNAVVINDSEHECLSECMPIKYFQKDSDTNEFVPDTSENDNIITEEMKILMQRHDHELERLQRKHTQERLNLKAQLETCSTMVLEQCDVIGR